MGSKAVLITVVCAVAVLCLSEAAPWYAGFSAQSISPRAGDRCCLGGYGECLCREQTGVHDDIYARALYLSLGTEEIVFVSIDTTGMSNRFIDDAISNVSDIIKDNNRVILSSTHSHSAPDFAGIWGGVGHGYRAYCISQIRAAVLAAVKGAVQATLKIAHTQSFATNNRRGWDSTDYTVLALWAEDHAGKLIGLTVNFGAHPTILGSSNTLASRDWVDGLIVTLENTLGKDKAMYVNAAQGDVSASRNGLQGNTTFDRAFEYGSNLANIVLAAINTPANVSVVGEEFYFSMENFTQCVTNNAFIAAANSMGLCADYNFGNPHGECPHSLLSLPPKTVDTQVAYLRLGREVQLAIIPGEACTRMAIDGVGKFIDFVIELVLKGK